MNPHSSRSNPVLLHHYVLRHGLCLSFPFHTCATRYMDGFSSPLPLFQVFRSSLCRCVIVPSGSGSSRQIISRSGPFLSRHWALPGAVRPSVFHLSVRACSSEDRVQSDVLSLACGEWMGFGSAEGSSRCILFFRLWTNTDTFTWHHGGAASGRTDVSATASLFASPSLLYYFSS